MVQLEQKRILPQERAAVSRAIIAAFWGLWFLPAFGIGYLIARFGVDVPYMDQIAIGDFLQRVTIGEGLTWHDLIAQHNESRKFFPRLLFLGLAQLSHWDQRYEMLASLVTVEITVLALLWISFRSTKNQLLAMGIAMFVNVLLLLPVQWQDFLWGIQWIVFVPTAALAIIMAVLASELNLWIATAIAAASAIVSTYSYANGMIVWVLAAPFFLLHRSPSNLRALGLWIVLAVVSIAYYFHGYVKPPQTPSMLLALKNPIEALFFFLSFLGNGLRPNLSIKYNMILGAVAIAAWTLGCLLIIASLDLNLFRRTLPWTTFGAYALSGAMITTLGRMGFGTIHALEPRYCTFALPLWASIVPIWVILFENWNSQNKVSTGPVVIAGFSCVAAILIVAAQGTIFIRSELTTFHQERLAARTVVQFSSLFSQPQAVTQLIYPDPNIGAIILQRLDHANLLHAGVFNSDDISPLAVNDPTHPGGSFSPVTLQGDKLVVSGWAYIPPRNALVDAILLTTPDGAGVDRIRAVVVENDRVHRPDVADVMHIPAIEDSGFTELLDPTGFSAGVPVTAWAYDTFAKKAYRLAGSSPVPAK